MANVSVAVEIETRIERDLSIAFQGVADDQSVNVGTLLRASIKEMSQTSLRYQLAGRGQRPAEALVRPEALAGARAWLLAEQPLRFVDLAALLSMRDGYGADAAGSQQQRRTDSAPETHSIFPQRAPTEFPRQSQ